MNPDSELIINPESEKIIIVNLEGLMVAREILSQPRERNSVETVVDLLLKVPISDFNSNTTPLEIINQLSICFWIICDLPTKDKIELIKKLIGHKYHRRLANELISITERIKLSKN